MKKVLLLAEITWFVIILSVKNQSAQRLFYNRVRSIL